MLKGCNVLVRIRAPGRRMHVILKFVTPGNCILQRKLK